MIPDLDKKVPVWLCGADSKNIVKSLGTSTSSEKQELRTDEIEASECVSIGNTLLQHIINYFFNYLGQGS